MNVETQRELRFDDTERRAILKLLDEVGQRISGPQRITDELKLKLTDAMTSAGEDQFVAVLHNTDILGLHNVAKIAAALNVLGLVYHRDSKFDSIMLADYFASYFGEQ